MEILEKSYREKVRKAEKQRKRGRKKGECNTATKKKNSKFLMSERALL